MTTSTDFSKTSQSSIVGFEKVEKFYNEVYAGLETCVASYNDDLERGNNQYRMHLSHDSGAFRLESKTIDGEKGDVLYAAYYEGSTLNVKDWNSEGWDTNPALPTNSYCVVTRLQKELTLYCGSFLKSTPDEQASVRERKLIPA